MTNSQKSDSIAEKSEVVKTEAKSNCWNWKTATIALATAVVSAISRLCAKLDSLRRRFNHRICRQSVVAVKACATSGALITGFLLIGSPIKTQTQPAEEEIEYSEVYQSWSYIYINDKDSNTIAVCAITRSSQGSRDSGFYIEIKNGRINLWPNYMVHTFMRTAHRVGNRYQQRNCQWAIDYSNPNNISGYLREVWCSLILKIKRFNIVNNAVKWNSFEWVENHSFKKVPSAADGTLRHTAQPPMYSQVFDQEGDAIIVETDEDPY